MSANAVFKAKWPSDAAGIAPTARGLSPQRLKTLEAVRWALIALSALLIARSPAAGSLLTPLLLIAIFLGRPRRPSCVPEAPVIVTTGRRRPVTLH